MYFPKPHHSERSHQVSAFWKEQLPHIRAFGSDDSIAIMSSTTLRDPQSVGQLQARLTRQGKRLERFIRRIGKLAAILPHTWWGKVVYWMARVDRGIKYIGETREHDLATRAFNKTFESHPNPVLRLDTLKEVPVLRDQVIASPLLSLYIAYMVNTLGPYLVSHRVRSVLEIGPGSALLAISLNRLFRCRFILVDLPEVLNLGFAMLSYYAQDSEIVLPNEVDEHGESVWQKDFVLLCPEQVNLIPRGVLDCAINCSSFQEMTYPLIKSYFELIDRCLRDGGLFYCLNEERFTRHPDGTVVEFDKYPWSPDFRDLFHEECEYWRVMKANCRKHRLQMKRKNVEGNAVPIVSGEGAR
jgi:putative sugar O-methyltransferase